MPSGRRKLYSPPFPAVPHATIVAMAPAKKRKFVPKKKPKNTLKKQIQVSDRPIVLKEFPQISRIISRISIIAFFIFLATFSLVSIGENRAKTYITLKQRVLQKPSNADRHQQLGEYFEGLNDFRRARQEYRLAALFGGTDVSALLQRITSKEQAPLVIQQAIAEWGQFLQSHPEYRDGWMALALLSWQVGDDIKLREGVVRALSFDSSYQPALKLESLLPND